MSDGKKPFRRPRARFVDDLDDVELGEVNPSTDVEEVFDPRARYTIQLKQASVPDFFAMVAREKRTRVRDIPKDTPLRIYRRTLWGEMRTYDLETVELPPSNIFGVRYDELVPLNDYARAFLAEEALEGQE